MKWFLCIVVVFFVFLSSGRILSAQETSPTPIESGPSATPSVTPGVAYDLAYPGLLPDHPLYFFKVIRDKVVSSLINDPIKRAEFNLLTSDKRFNAAVYLVEKEKYDKAIDTLSKSTNYFHDSIVALEKAKSLDRDVNSIKDTESVAIDKRLEIMKGLSPEFPDEHAEAVEQETTRIKKLKDRLNDL